MTMTSEEIHENPKLAKCTCVLPHTHLSNCTRISGESTRYHVSGRPSVVGSLPPKQELIKFLVVFWLIEMILIALTLIALLKAITLIIGLLP